MRLPPYEPGASAGPWPGGRRVAVWPVVNIERFELGVPGPALQPHLVSGLDIANYAWRDYGLRAGVHRVFAVFDDLGLPATAALNASLCHLCPDVVAGVVERGWEVMAHGWDNSGRHADLTPEEEGERIRATVATLADATGAHVGGWLTPGFALSPVTLDLLAEAGLDYTADWCGDDRPLWWPTGSGRLLAIPYSLETNDITLLLSMRYPPDRYVQAVVDHVAQLCTEPGGTVVALGLHPFLVGQPGRVAHLRRCLETVAALPGVWVATGRDIHAITAKERENDELSTAERP
jgi:peptidoglycan/xylan/chitin deacetylase (PgdA/CDA1 family)